MALYLDKYKPLTFGELSYHREQGEHLTRLAASQDLPHLLVHGPDGAGKKTRINCFLREVYGPGVDKVKIEQREIMTSSQVKFEVTILSSLYHLEINPSESGLKDRFVIQTLLKEIAQTQQLYKNNQRVAFKIIVVHETDKLSKEAQQALRRTMEKYVSTCRLILLCNNGSKVIDPIRSRCVPIRIACPSVENILSILYSIADKENFTLTPEVADKIVTASERNLRKAILLLEATKVQTYPFTQNQKIVMLGWETFLVETVQIMLDNQTPASLVEVRTRLYELLAHCIPPELILKRLAQELANRNGVNSTIKQQIYTWAAHYDHRIVKGSRPIFHLEAFVAKFMQLYKLDIINMSYF